jgi:uncharacterized 2Fe-2S/4Fe-4S cluster protein (DUF4445 family)
MSEKYSLTFLPQERVTHAPAGMSIFNAANWIGLAIDSTCGGRGTCGKCKVRFVAGANGVTNADRKYLSQAELAEGWRLSCKSMLQSPSVVEVPRLMTSPKAALLGYGRHVALDPNVAKLFLQLREPTLEDQTPDLERVKDALRAEGYEVRTSLALWRALPAALRASDWAVTAVVCGDELIALEPGDTTAENYGLSIDIGTTTVVTALLNLNTGAIEAVDSDLNWQAPFGADVISRISHTMSEPDGAAGLQKLVVGTINGLIEPLLAQAGVARDRLYEVVVAGNATMLHLLLGIDPEPIAMAPFIPAVEESVTVRAADVGLQMHPEARLTTLPHIGAYVGADIVGGVLATGLVQEDRVRLLVDVGTNGEIVLGSSARAVATAAPAGPAFEGAQIKCGMRASTGAIEGVSIRDDVTVQIIGGDVPPRGICGSGLVDVVAELVRCGLVDKSGKLLRPEEAAGRFPETLVGRLVETAGVRAFTLCWPAETGGEPIVLTQQDIRALQFAKGAIAGGVRVVMDYMGLKAADLDEVLLAGSFGSYINPESAKIIGLVPAVPTDRIAAVGNAAGEGAKIALLSYRQRLTAMAIPDFVEYIELSGRTDFTDAFIEVMAFPELEAA